LPNKSVIFASIVVLGSAGTSMATPMNEPGTVHIGRSSCDRVCRSYIAWSRRVSSAFALRLPKAFFRHAGARHAHVAKHAAAKPSEMPQAKIADVQPAAKPAGPDTTPASIADPRPIGAFVVGSSPRTPQEQVLAATAVAELLTTATTNPASEQKANNSKPTDSERTTPTPSNKTDQLVALLIARPEIKSVSDLTGKTVAIDKRHAAFNDQIRAAILAAGANEAQLSDGETKATDRVMGGDVPAAIFALVSSEAADGFPEIAGYKIFRIPISPPPLKARLE
jgi:hypothetical protein